MRPTVPFPLDGIPAALVPCIFLLIFAGLEFGNKLRDAMPISNPAFQMALAGITFVAGLLIGAVLLFLPAYFWNREPEPFYQAFPRVLLTKSAPRRSQAFAAAFTGYQLLCVPLVWILAQQMICRVELLACEIALVSLFLMISYCFGK